MFLHTQSRARDCVCWHCLKPARAHANRYKRTCLGKGRGWWGGSGDGTWGSGNLLVQIFPTTSAHYYKEGSDLLDHVLILAQVSLF